MKRSIYQARGERKGAEAPPEAARKPADDAPHNTETIPAHRYADLFPEMSEQDFTELCASIKRDGLLDLIVFHDEDDGRGEQILDGRHRYKACLATGTTPLFTPYNGDDPLGFVIAKNLRRRQLSTSQRSMIAAELGRLGWGGDRSKSSKADLNREQRATALNVGYASVERADIVADQGVPELKAAVRDGQVAVTTAVDIAKLPKDQQQEILAEIAANPDGRKALKQVAKKARAEDQKVRHEERQHRLEKIAERNPAFPAGRKFSFVLIDVPRHHVAYSDDTGSEKAPENHFPTLPFNELCDFDIDKFATPDSVIAYWSTAASLIDDLDILAEWGFVALRRRDEHGKLLRGEDGQPLPPVGGGLYGSHQIWRKRRSGKQMGTGRWFRDQHEILILARRGNAPAPLPGTQDESVFDAPIGEHSEKPGEHVRAWIDRCWPHLEKIEVFARGNAPPGWTFWGNQAAVIEKIVNSPRKRVPISPTEDKPPRTVAALVWRFLKASEVTAETRRIYKTQILRNAGHRSLKQIDRIISVHCYPKQRYRTQKLLREIDIAWSNLLGWARSQGLVAGNARQQQ